MSDLHKSAFKDMLDYVEEMIGNKRVIELFQFFGYTEDEIRELGVEVEEDE